MQEELLSEIVYGECVLYQPLKKLIRFLVHYQTMHGYLFIDELFPLCDSAPITISG